MKEITKYTLSIFQSHSLAISTQVQFPLELHLFFEHLMSLCQCISHTINIKQMKCTRTVHELAILFWLITITQDCLHRYCFNQSGPPQFNHISYHILVSWTIDEYNALWYCALLIYEVETWDLLVYKVINLL